MHRKKLTFLESKDLAIIGYWEARGIPCALGEEWVRVLDRVFAIAQKTNPRLIRHLLRVTRKMADMSPKGFKAGYIRQIKNHFPRKPGGRPRAYEVDLAQELWAQGKSDSEIGVSIFGEAEWREMGPIERGKKLKRLKTALQGRAHYKRIKRTRRRKETVLGEFLSTKRV